MTFSIGDTVYVSGLYPMNGFVAREQIKIENNEIDMWPYISVCVQIFRSYNDSYFSVEMNANVLHTRMVLTEKIKVKTV